MIGVVIVDSRPKWQQAEDKQHACLINCKYFMRCSLRDYIDCNINGGTIIPRMRGFKNERVLQKHGDD